MKRKAFMFPAHHIALTPVGGHNILWSSHSFFLQPAKEEKSNLGDPTNTTSSNETQI
jgi:hypothetical protein